MGARSWGWPQEGSEFVPAGCSSLCHGTRLPHIGCIHQLTTGLLSNVHNPKIRTKVFVNDHNRCVSAEEVQDL